MSKTRLDSWKQGTDSKIVEDFAKDNNCKILEELRFEAFVWVSVE